MFSLVECYAFRMRQHYWAIKTIFFCYLYLTILGIELDCIIITQNLHALQLLLELLINCWGLKLVKQWLTGSFQCFDHFIIVNIRIRSSIRKANESTPFCNQHVCLYAVLCCGWRRLGPVVCSESLVKGFFIHQVIE